MILHRDSNIIHFYVDFYNDFYEIENVENINSHILMKLYIDFYVYLSLRYGKVFTYFNDNFVFNRNKAVSQKRNYVYKNVCLSRNFYEDCIENRVILVIAFFEEIFSKSFIKRFYYKNVFNG